MALKFTKTAAALCALAAAGPAMADGLSFAGGDLSFYTGVLSLNDNLDNDYSFTNGSVTGIAARMAFTLSPKATLQFDMNHERVVDGESVEEDKGDNAYSVSNFAAHIIGSSAAGAGQYGVMLSRGVDLDWWDEGFLTAALEGSYSVGSARLSGQVGTTIGDDDANALYIRIGADIDVTEQLTVGLNGSMGTIDYSDGSDTVHFTALGLNVEYAFANAPYSAFATYQFSAEEERDEEGDAWNKGLLTVGMRVRFGHKAATPVFADYNPLTGVEHVRFSDWE